MKLGRVDGDGIPAQCRKFRWCRVTWGHLPPVLTQLSPLAAFLKRPGSAKDVGQGHDYLMVLDVSDDDFLVL